METPARGSPPSTYAIWALVEHEPGALGRVFGWSLIRAGLILPGLYLGGIRGKQLITGSLLSSFTLSGILYFYDKIKAAKAEAATDAR